jgi:hypothetical protein
MENNLVYIELVRDGATGRYEFDRQLIVGEFTRPNVAAWLENLKGPDPSCGLPVKDFHAICGDVDIPWATEEAKLHWAKTVTKAS